MPHATCPPPSTRTRTRHGPTTWDTSLPPHPGGVFGLRAQLGPLALRARYRVRGRAQLAGLAAPIRTEYPR